MQKNRPRDQIIGNKNDGVQTRRKARNTEKANLCPMIKMEPETFDEANKREEDEGNGRRIVADRKDQKMGGGS